MALRHLIAVAAILSLPASASSQRTETGFLNRTIVDGTETRAYQVFVPRAYTPTRRWPVILFLHGGGQQGLDGVLPTEGGLGAAIRQHHERFPAIVVFPQVRPGKRWNGQDAALALRALEEAQKEFVTDPNRVYLTGVSRGGAGAYYLAYRDPDRFAAVLICCGRVTPATTLDGLPAPDLDPVVPTKDGNAFTALAATLNRTPVWVFHGDADTVISVDESRRAVEALRKVGAPVKYSELKGVDHNAWNTIYTMTGVAEWLFAQSRTGR